MNTRRTGGRETWHRLREWDKAQADSERLAARLLSMEGYSGIDPSHPLGGPDGGRDIICAKDGRNCVVAVYFPRGQRTYGEIQTKFTDDLGKARRHSAEAIIFFTNQELTLSERDELAKLASPINLDTYHLERIASCLDSPSGYGLRLEFVSIEMTKEEQVSFFNERDQVLYEIKDRLLSLTTEKKGKVTHSGIATVPIQQINSDFYNSTYSIFGSKLMECKSCGEIFRAQRTASASLFMSYGGLETVTCPACGKVQAFR